MRWEPRRHLPVVAGLALIVAAVGLVAPWWTVDRQAGGTETEIVVSPFDPGPDSSAVSEGAVTGVGVLAFVGIVGLVGGLVLGFRADERDGETSSVAGWLWMASGGFLLVAPLTAVLSWPAAGTSFWGSSSLASTTFQAAASWGWYVTLAAGAIGAVAGIAWLYLNEPSIREGTI